MLYRSKGERPILLLDETSAELDGKKQEKLLDLLQGQVFYASTQMPSSLAEKHKAGRFFNIERGVVEVS
jgi:recombinational DNA repair ATPase RecF